MSTPEAYGETTLQQRIVLLALADLDGSGETPANPVEVADCCSEFLDDVAADVLAAPSEVETTRALNELAAGPLVGETRAGDDSPVGKGRPVYAPADDAGTVLDALAGDDRLAEVVRRFREESG